LRALEQGKLAIREALLLSVLETFGGEALRYIPRGAGE